MPGGLAGKDQSDQQHLKYGRELSASTFPPVGAALGGGDTATRRRTWCILTGNAIAEHRDANAEKEYSDGAYKIMKSADHVYVSPPTGGVADDAAACRRFNRGGRRGPSAIRREPGSSVAFESPAPGNRIYRTGRFGKKNKLRMGRSWFDLHAIAVGFVKLLVPTKPVQHSPFFASYITQMTPRFPFLVNGALSKNIFSAYKI